ncbi:uncharacterized protein C8orf58 homolog [Camelus ferus]|uniref:Uncharacterized protein C8orf58 homolog n=2 Tax=Camelus TaxID=9836 RepID=A0A8B8S9A4_CAMFR|nr:uncharacterized protein C8orf58 homolog [Camelus ferus]
MLGRRRVFAVEPLGGRDVTGEDPARGCLVPGVTSTYRPIPDAAPGYLSDSWEGGGKLRGLERQVPLLKLASQDSGVEMAAGDSSPATSRGLSQDSLTFEPMGSPEALALGAVEDPTHKSRLLASRKLEQVLERSRQLPTSPASLSQHYRSLSPPCQPECEKPLFGAGGQEATEAESDLEAGLEEAEVVRPEAQACLPGQGLRYLEHLCLVLEQTARLQQLYLQLQTRRAGDPEEEESEESAVAPSSPSSHAPGSEVHEPWERLSQTEKTGAKTASPPKAGVPSPSPPRLSEAPAEQAHTFSSSQGHRVKVLLNRIRWRSPRPAEPAALPDSPAPRTASGGLRERPPCHPPRKTFMPSLAVKKQRTKNLSVH